MPDRADSNLTDKLLAEGFARTGPVATSLSDPIADTPMLLTLDQLAPYELDPRLTRNPKYDEIKASIRERGLDSPPTVTRRPGGDKYIIRNGGNTRLAILRELWTETKDERFYRISCLFKPWRNEITALTGHLSENELRGGLTFIERALGVDKARELYEAESGKPLSQSELARRLAADGFAVPRPHISRMQDTLMYLLPAIPNVLYGGLGRPQIEKLTILRNAASRLWDQRSGSLPPTEDFQTCFHEVLAAFDGPSASFSIQRVQDELIGRLAETFNTDYDLLALALSDATQMQELINSAPRSSSAEPSAPSAGQGGKSVGVLSASEAELEDDEVPSTKVKQTTASDAGDAPLSQVKTTKVPSSLQDGPTSARHADQQVVDSAALRLQSYELAHGLASAFGKPDAVAQSPSRSGFTVDVGSIGSDSSSAESTMLIVLALLSGWRHVVSAGTDADVISLIDASQLIDLLLDQEMPGGRAHRLSDEHLNGLFALIRQLRQLGSQELQHTVSRQATA